MSAASSDRPLTGMKGGRPREADDPCAFHTFTENHHGFAEGDQSAGSPTVPEGASRTGIAARCSWYGVGRSSRSKRFLRNGYVFPRRHVAAVAGVIGAHRLGLVSGK